MNVRVFKHLTKRFRTLSQVTHILSKPIKMKYMPLGKYKGRLFTDIPLEYLLWASKMDFDQDLLFSIRSEIKARKKGTGFAQANNPFLGL